MKLSAKFSIIFIIVFGLGLIATGYLSYSLLQKNAREQIDDRAKIMMETALAMRRYTSEQVKPVINQAVKRTRETNDDFQPETVPAYAATEMFSYLHEKYPDYSYKEAADNPTNPRDRAMDWEKDIIDHFRNNPNEEIFAGERDTPMGRSLYLARPLRAAAGCLECHSTPAAAPPAMIAHYGSENGFGWRENDVIAAQIVSVPASLPVQMAKHEFRELMTLLIVVGVITLIAVNLVLMMLVVRPVGELARRAEEISEGKMETTELPCRGHCEISMLVASFNRMHRSLSAAMKLLDKE